MWGSAEPCTSTGISTSVLPRHPRTNGKLGYFNGRLCEVLATNHSCSGEHLAETLLCYVNVYDYSFPQRALGHGCPLEALEPWRLNA